MEVRHGYKGLTLLRRRLQRPDRRPKCSQRRIVARWDSPLRWTTRDDLHAHSSRLWSFDVDLDGSIIACLVLELGRDRSFSRRPRVRSGQPPFTDQTHTLSSFEEAVSRPRGERGCVERIRKFNRISRTNSRRQRTPAGGTKSATFSYRQRQKRIDRHLIWLQVHRLRY